MQPSAQKIQTTLSFSETPLVLVAGGAGFLGSFLCEELLKLNCRVVCIDNLSVGKKENLTNCALSPNFYFLQKDLNDPDLAKTIAEKFSKVAYLFQLTSSGALNILEIAKKDQAKLLLKLPEDPKKEAEFLAYYQKLNLDTRCVRVSDVYGPRFCQTKKDTLSKILFEAYTKNIIHIPNDGLDKVYPTYISDVIKGLLSSMFGANTSGRTINVINPQVMTTIGFARELCGVLKTAPEVVIGKEESVNQPTLSIIGKEINIGWSPQILLSQGLSETISWLQKSPKTTMEQKEETPGAQNFQEKVIQANIETIGLTQKFVWPKILPNIEISLRIGKKGRFVGLAILGGLILLVWPFLSLVWNLKNGISQLQTTEQTMALGKTSEAQKNIISASDSFSAGKNDLRRTVWLFNLLSKQNDYDSLLRLLDLAQKGSDSAVHLFSAARLYSEAGSAILSGGSVNLSDKLNSGQEELSTADDGLAFLQAELIKGSLNIPGPSWLKNLLGAKDLDQKIKTLTVKFGSARQYISQARVLGQIAPGLIGLNGKKTYLLLFANNMELRPGGGFIGSYGLLTLENGKLSDLKIEDIYTADGQLTGHVEPPVPIRKYLDQPHWYLRDSNWSPDFREAAAQAEWFLEKEVGQRVDGTILLDLNTAKNILSALGPLYLTDYGINVDENNLFAQASSHSEKDFFPGSTQKKDFLGALSRKMLDQIIQFGPTKGTNIALALFKSFKQKHLSLYFHDQATENIINRFNLGGGLGEGICSNGSNCLDDYLMVVDANLGVNKANYFVKENTDHQVVIDTSGNVRENVTLTYNNTSPGETWPGGTYKDYLRLFLPLGSEVGNIQINGSDVSFAIGLAKLDRKVPTGTLEVDQEDATASAKTMVGFLVTIPPKTQQTVSISYNLGKKMDISSKGQFSLLVQKQLGSQENNYNLKINHPLSLVAKANPLPKQIQPGEILYSQPLWGDTIFSLNYSPQTVK